MRPTNIFFISQCMAYSLRLRAIFCFSSEIEDIFQSLWFGLTPINFLCNSILAAAFCYVFPWKDFCISRFLVWRKKTSPSSISIFWTYEVLPDLFLFFDDPLAVWVSSDRTAETRSLHCKSFLFHQFHFMRVIGSFPSIFLISPYSNISSFNIYASLHQFIKYRLFAAMRLLLLISSCLLVLCSADFCGTNKVPYGFEAHKDGGVALLCTRPECHEKKFAVSVRK